MHRVFQIDGGYVSDLQQLESNGVRPVEDAFIRAMDVVKGLIVDSEISFPMTINAKLVLKNKESWCISMEVESSD